MPTIKTDQLLRRIADGDLTARDALLARHRGRLRQMVALRLDRRVAARVDPSDVVQETLLEAAQSFLSTSTSGPCRFTRGSGRSAGRSSSRYTDARQRKTAVCRPGIAPDGPSR